MSTSTRTEASLDAGVLHLELVSDDGRNTFDDIWFSGFAEALRGALARREVRAVLLSARGQAFSFGMNLRGLDPGARSKPFAEWPVAVLTQTLSAFDKPLVAAVHGHAIGGAATLLLHCDLAVAAADTRFRLPFTGLGVVPELGSSFLLPRAAGAKLANELVLLGAMFDAEQALRAGFVNAVVEPGQELVLARQWATQLATLPPAAIQASKRLLRQPQMPGLAEAIAREGAELSAAMGRGEIAEAVAAFREKRAPDFSRFF